MEKANSNLKQENIFKDYRSLAQAVWNNIVTVHDNLKIPNVTLTISDHELEFVLSYALNGQAEFISFPYRALDKMKAFKMVYALAEKSSIKGKVFCEKTVMHFTFH